MQALSVESNASSGGGALSKLKALSDSLPVLVFKSLLIAVLAVTGIVGELDGAYYSTRSGITSIRFSSFIVNCFAAAFKFMYILGPLLYYSCRAGVKDSFARWRENQKHIAYVCVFVGLDVGTFVLAYFTIVGCPAQQLLRFVTVGISGALLFAAVIDLMSMSCGASDDDPRLGPYDRSDRSNDDCTPTSYRRCAGCWLMMLIGVILTTLILATANASGHSCYHIKCRSLTAAAAGGEAPNTIDIYLGRGKDNILGNLKIENVLTATADASDTDTTTVYFQEIRTCRAAELNPNGPDTYVSTATTPNPSVSAGWVAPVPSTDKPICFEYCARERCDGVTTGSQSTPIPHWTVNTPVFFLHACTPLTYGTTGPSCTTDESKNLDRVVECTLDLLQL